MTTPADIAARVAGELGLPADDPRVADATDAAITLATHYVYGSAPVPSAPPVPVLDLEDPLHRHGLTALAVRLFLDPRSSSGSIESDTYTGDVMPDDPMSHVHHYFDPARAMTGTVGIA